MKTGVKILIAAGAAIALGVGGYFIFRPKKEEKQPGTNDLQPPIEPVIPITAPTLSTDTTIIPVVAPVPPIYQPPTLATPTLTPDTVLSSPNVTPKAIILPPHKIPGADGVTPEEYIRMADNWMYWKDLWDFAARFGITDKTLVGGVTGVRPDAIITPNSRLLFQKEVIDKYPTNWVSAIKQKAASFGIPVISDEQYLRDSINKYPITTGVFPSSSQFTGKSIKNNKINDFFTGN